MAANNTNPDFLPGEDFFTIFALFFPAMTGLLAGANMSGDLRDAARDIPRGTFISIAIASLGNISRSQILRLDSHSFICCPM